MIDDCSIRLILQKSSAEFHRLHRKFWNQLDAKSTNQQMTTVHSNHLETKILNQNEYKGDITFSTQGIFPPIINNALRLI
jgi:hypothetical protein